MLDDGFPGMVVHVEVGRGAVEATFDVSLGVLQGIQTDTESAQFVHLC